MKKMTTTRHLLMWAFDLSAVMVIVVLALVLHKCAQDFLIGLGLAVIMMVPIIILAWISQWIFGV